MNQLIKRTLMSSVASFFTSPLKYSFSSILQAKPTKKPQVTFSKWMILRGDVVKVITGKDKGKVGKVSRVWRKQNKITVKGVNIKTKFVSNLLLIQKILKVSLLLKKEHIQFTYQTQVCMTVRQRGQLG